MTEWAAKRFWTRATAVASTDGWGVALDDRPLRTPAKVPLMLPTRALAEAVAAEWQAQPERIQPERMPLTRTANSAIDKVIPQRVEVATMLAAYGGHDLLCYRAAGPAELVARQAMIWDPLLDWATARFDARLAVTTGVLPVPQDVAALDRLAAEVHAYPPFFLAGFHDLVGLSGSLVLGLAVAAGRVDPGTAWGASRIDEDWQAEQWGTDDEAAAAAAFKRAAFLDAARFCLLVS